MNSGRAKGSHTVEDTNAQRFPTQKDSISLPYLPSRSDALQRWTDGIPGTKDIVQEAHDDAIRNLKTEFQGKDGILAWLEKLTTIEEVQSQVSELQKRYGEDVKFQKAKRWLHKFSSVVLHYGQALDMLAQQHPEYVSLVWGTMKFILTAVMNKEKQLAEYSEALVYIGELLPRAQLNVELYQNEFVKAAVARLYEQILLFFKPAIKWYSSTLRRFWLGVFEPFEVLKDTVTKIKACVAILNEAAMSSMQVEIRQTHDIASKSHEILSRKISSFEGWQNCLSAEVSELRQDLKAALEIVYGIQDKVHSTDRRAGEIQTRARGIEFRLEFKNLKPSTLPTKALVRQRSVSRTKQPWTMQNQDTVNLIKSIGDWIESPESAFLAIETKQGKEIAAELIGSIFQPKAKHICWHLSDQDEVVTTARLLSSLAWQLHELDAPTVARCVNGNVEHTSEQQMAELLCLILIQLRNCYIIVEANETPMSEVGLTHMDKLSSLLQDIIDRVSDIGSQVKVLLIGNGRTGFQPAQSSAPSSSKSPKRMISLRPSAPIPASRRRPGMKTLFQEPGWLNLQNRIPKQALGGNTKVQLSRT